MAGTVGGREYFGKWLDRTLAARRLSTGEVGRALGLKDTSVSRWRHGTSPPSVKNAQALADLLGVDAIRLMVTAGLLKPEAVNSQPFELPSDSARRELVRAQLEGIRGLTARQRRVLLEAYDADLAREDET